MPLLSASHPLVSPYLLTRVLPQWESHGAAQAQGPVAFLLLDAGTLCQAFVWPQLQLPRPLLSLLLCTMGSSPLFPPVVLQICGDLPAARPGLVFTCTGRGEWMVCACGVLHRIHSPFPTRVIEESPILQAGPAPADPSSAAASPVSGSAAVCVLQAQLCRRRLSRFLVTSCY